MRLIKPGNQRIDLRWPHADDGQLASMGTAHLREQ